MSLEPDVMYYIYIIFIIYIHIKYIICIYNIRVYMYVIEKKRLQRYGPIKRMPEERIPILIMEWIPLERRKRRRPRKTWIAVQAAMTTRNLEPDQWRNGGE